MYGHFSVKSDVFSFGVLVLENVSGQKNNCFRNGDEVQDLLSAVCPIVLMIFTTCIHYSLYIKWL